MMLVPPPVLHEASICLVCYANIEGLRVWAERQTSYLTEKVNLVRFAIICKTVVDMDEIYRLRCCQESPIRREFDTAYRA
jgi:hypothetical protein